MEGPFSLFSAFGVELEYMIVDRQTLAVRPIADKLLEDATGTPGASDFVNGPITWSNEMAMHVIELKNSHPTSDLVGLEKLFQENIHQINGMLEAHGAVLLSSAMHPLMDPSVETQLWPHEGSSIYQAYHRIFNCYRHGWANIQSVHLNLPFVSEEDFGRLHAAIRLVLPIIPALCASSPIKQGKITGNACERLAEYNSNQQRLPAMAGAIIPEPLFTQKHYNQVYTKIAAEISAFDTAKELNPVWLNSRGAIARFDRGSIEIRLMDIQENPSIDLALCGLFIYLLKALVQEQHISYQQQKIWTTANLAAILHQAIKEGLSIELNTDYLEIFGYSGTASTLTCKEFLKYLMDTRSSEADLKPWVAALQNLITSGNLSQRLSHSVKSNLTEKHIKKVYFDLTQCLQAKLPFNL